MILAYVGVRILNRGKRHFVPVGLTALQKDHRLPFFIYVPFQKRVRSVKFPPMQSIEDLLKKEPGGQWHCSSGFWIPMNKLSSLPFGILVRWWRLVILPMELPHLGAYRIYVGQEGDWQQMVSMLASKASYVILQIGHSDGLMWEVQYIVNHVRPEQLILCLPNEKIKITRLSGPKKREQKRQQIYEGFRVKTQEFFPKPLPLDIGRAMFIYFDQDWNAQVSLFRSEPLFSKNSKKTQFNDPKLEALNWLNSALY